MSSIRLLLLSSPLISTGLSKLVLIVGMLAAPVFPAIAQELVYYYYVFPSGTELTCQQPDPTTPIWQPTQQTLQLDINHPAPSCPTYYFSFWTYNSQITVAIQLLRV